MNQKKIVVLTGAGISKESGIPTFRDLDGIWKQYDYMEVASATAWKKNPDLVLDHYNERRKLAWTKEPNAAHLALARLDAHFDTMVITQNVDALHEKAGQQRILHLHGELHKVREVRHPKDLIEWGDKPLAMGDLGPKGSQLRPHIVMFGEDVPMMPLAARLTELADIFVVVGTSLNVYPAAGLIQYAPAHADVYIVDPALESDKIPQRPRTTYIAKKASEGVPELVDDLIRQFS